MRRATILTLFLLVVAASPEAVSACERCFGAGSDAPAVRAVSASMMVLFALMSGVFMGIVGFFRKMSVLSEDLEQAQASPSSNQTEQGP